MWLLLGTWLLVSGCAPPRPAAPAPATTPPVVAITIGMVSAHPREIADIAQPFADAVARRLAPNQPARGQVAITSTVAEMADLLRAGKVDLYVDSPFPAVTAAEQSGGVPFLRRWKKVQAGGTDEVSLKTFAGDQLGSLRILMTSPDVPRHIVVHRPGLKSERVRAISEALASLDRDDEGRSILAQFEKTSRFDALAPDAVETIQSLRRIAALLD